MRNLLFMLTLLVVTTPQAHACMLSEAEKSALFEQYDTNHDGRLSRAEYITAEAARTGKHSPQDRAFLRQRFTETMDHDKTGFITPTAFSPISLRKCR